MGLALAARVKVRARVGIRVRVKVGSWLVVGKLSEAHRSDQPSRPAYGLPPDRTPGSTDAGMWVERSGSRGCASGIECTARARIDAGACTRVAHEREQ